MERTPNFIKVWFWPRNSVTVPAEVVNGFGSINTDAWGVPTANFPNTACDIPSHFAPANIIINLTFCESLVRPCVLVSVLELKTFASLQVETGPARSTASPDAPGPAKV
jgi:hypothetical protein